MRRRTLRQAWLSQLGGPEMPGVGFGMGMERLLLVMEGAGVIVIPEPQPLQIFLCTMGQAAREKAFSCWGSCGARGFPQIWIMRQGA